MLSRPRVALRTRPAFSMTRRCLVIAWRVMGKPPASLAMDIGPASHRRETRRRRVSSPSAAKIDAEPASSVRLACVSALRKILLDQGGLHAPALFVRRERLRAALERNAIEAGFRDRQQDAAGRSVEREHDERGRLARIVDAGVDG